MAWYNEVKNMEENATSYFLNKTVDFELLHKLTKYYIEAKKHKENSFLPTLSLSVTAKQLNKHDDNCKDFEFKKTLVQYCINKLSNDY